MTNTNNQNNTGETIIRQNIYESLGPRFLNYAMSVITERALNC